MMMRSMIEALKVIRLLIFCCLRSSLAVVGFQLNCFCLGTESSRLIERGRFKRNRPHASLMIADLGRHKQPMKSSLLLGPTNKTHLSAPFNQLPTFCLPNRHATLLQSSKFKRVQRMVSDLRELDRSKEAADLIAASPTRIALPTQSRGGSL